MLSSSFLYMARSGQKACQLTLDEHQDLVDAVCLWLWLRPKLAGAMEIANLENLDRMFAGGNLCCK